MHREPSSGVPEQVHPHCGGTNKMTCHDSLVYTEMGESK